MNLWTTGDHRRKIKGKREQIEIAKSKKASSLVKIKLSTKRLLLPREEEAVMRSMTDGNGAPKARFQNLPPSKS